ncbi:MAG: DNA repair protein RecO [Elusimicrobia bacterium]|nr:DNA repair protein RecO [Elusimicrobiota bacterium]
MNFCDLAIVLKNTQLRENDRIATVYTRLHGKLDIVFKSVRVSKGKLKALSEVFVWGDYRLFLKNERNIPICTGGEILSVFPSIRADIKKMFLVFYFCEIISRLTPFNQPNEEKYSLLLSALKDLESNKKISVWMRPAFALRFMELAGSGFEKTAVGIDSRIWKVLHIGTWQEVNSLKTNDLARNYIDELIRKFMGDHLNYKLRTEEFL